MILPEYVGINTLDGSDEHQSGPYFCGENEEPIFADCQENLWELAEAFGHNHLEVLQDLILHNLRNFLTATCGSSKRLLDKVSGKDLKKEKRAIELFQKITATRETPEEVLEKFLETLLTPNLSDEDTDSLENLIYELEEKSKKAPIHVATDEKTVKAILKLSLESLESEEFVIYDTEKKILLLEKLRFLDGVIREHQILVNEDVRKALSIVINNSSVLGLDPEVVSIFKMLLNSVIETNKYKLAKDLLLGIPEENTGKGLDENDGKLLGIAADKLVRLQEIFEIANQRRLACFSDFNGTLESLVLKAGIHSLPEDKKNVVVSSLMRYFDLIKAGIQKISTRQNDLMESVKNYDPSSEGFKVLEERGGIIDQAQNIMDMTAMFEDLLSLQPKTFPVVPYQESVQTSVAENTMI